MGGTGSILLYFNDFQWFVTFSVWFRHDLHDLRRISVWSFSHNSKLWFYLTPIPERRRRLCRIWPFPTPPCHHDRGCSFWHLTQNYDFPQKSCFSHKIMIFQKYKWFSKVNFYMVHTNLFRSIVLARQIHFLKRTMTNSIYIFHRKDFINMF